jgi:hypothetical protein
LFLDGFTVLNHWSVKIKYILCVQKKRHIYDTEVKHFEQDYVVNMYFYNEKSVTGYYESFGVQVAVSFNAGLRKCVYCM